MSIFFSIGDFVLLCPWVLWGILCLVLKNIKYTKSSAIHFASDITMFFLLFSIREITHVLFDYDIKMLALILAVVLAMIMLVYEYKTKDEFTLSKVMKKIWRKLFLLFTCLYVVIVIVFIVMQFITIFK